MILWEKWRENQGAGQEASPAEQGKRGFHAEHGTRKLIFFFTGISADLEL